MHRGIGDVVGHELPQEAGFGTLADQAADEALEGLARGGAVVDGDLELLAADPDGVGVLAERDLLVMAGAIGPIRCPAAWANLAEEGFAALSIAGDRFGCGARSSCWIATLFGWHIGATLAHYLSEHKRVFRLILWAEQQVKADEQGVDDVRG
jgi:hypothetical protein